MEAAGRAVKRGGTASYTGRASTSTRGRGSAVTAAHGPVTQLSRLAQQPLGLPPAAGHYPDFVALCQLRDTPERGQRGALSLAPGLRAKRGI